MNLKKPIKLPHPLQNIWSYVWQWLKTWFFVTLFTCLIWPIFIPLGDWIFHPDDSGCGLFLLCGRELELFAISLFFANWFLISLLSLCRFKEIWHKILSIILFVFINYFVFGKDFFISNIIIISISLPLGILVAVGWQKYGKKIMEKGFYKKVILMIKKLLAVILVRAGLNLITNFILGINQVSFYQKIVIYISLIVLIFITYFILKRFFSLLFASILSALIIISVVIKYLGFHYDIFGLVAVNWVLLLIIIILAIWDSVLVIKKGKNNSKK